MAKTSIQDHELSRFSFPPSCLKKERRTNTSLYKSHHPGHAAQTLCTYLGGITICSIYLQQQQHRDKTQYYTIETHTTHTHISPSIVIHVNLFPIFLFNCILTMNEHLQVFMAYPKQRF